MTIMYVYNMYTDEGCECIRQRTFNELYHDVARYAAALRRLGVGPGDRVVG